ncbi:hypothetical protein VNO77_38929 [Canavalia gladiata]|uniref:Uncharacterized protein n=1 Tax=Canavalia gladiata TaxID=3824 RepID=A0AAN9KDH1_CANGL
MMSLGHKLNLIMNCMSLVYFVPDFCMNDNCKNWNRIEPRCYRILRPYLEFVRRRHPLQPPMSKLPCMQPPGFSFKFENLFYGDLVPLVYLSATHVSKGGAALDSYLTTLQTTTTSRRLL